MSDLVVKCRRQLLRIFGFHQNSCKKFFVVICLIADTSVLFYVCQGFWSLLPRLCTGTLTKVHVAVSKSSGEFNTKTQKRACVVGRKYFRFLSAKKSTATVAYVLGAWLLSLLPGKNPSLSLAVTNMCLSNCCPFRPAGFCLSALPSADSPLPILHPPIVP